MKKIAVLLIAISLVIVVAMPMTISAQENKPVFYWISHGSPADPVWTYFLDGAQQWSADTGIEVRTSFHSGDVPSHQEAFRAAEIDFKQLGEG